MSAPRTRLRDLPRRQLGQQGLSVAPIGFGCMGLSWAYGAALEETAAARLLERAVDLGVDFFDTAAIYADGENERLVGRALHSSRDRVVIATKFGYEQDDSGKRRIDSSPAAVRRSAERSLRNLGLERIDLFYQHRVDTSVPIEETMGAVKDLVREGKVRCAGLSEASATTVARAHAVFPLSALQIEYSIWERSCEAEILPCLRRLGIALVAYSPLGRGFLAGAAASADELSTGDYRHKDPRFASENAARNQTIKHALDDFGRSRGVSSAQVALAWLLARGPDIVPIPGTKRLAYLESNVAAGEMEMTGGEAAAIADALPPTAGDRYNAELMKTVQL